MKYYSISTKGKREHNEDDFIAEKINDELPLEFNVCFLTAILEFSANNNYKNNIKTLGIPDRFIEHGSVAELQRFIGLDVESLTSFISSLIK